MKYILLVVLISISLQIKAQNETLIKLEAIGDSIDASLNNYQKEYVNSLIDEESMIKIILDKKEGEEITAYERGVSLGIRRSLDFGELMLKQIGNGAHYGFVKAKHISDDNYSLLFRLYSEEGINYHGYLCTYRDDTVSINDIYIAIAGQTLGETLRSLLQSVNLNKNVKSKTESKSLEGLLKVVEIKQLVGLGRFDKAHKLYSKLPKKLKEQKAIKIYEVIINSNRDDKSYLKTMKEFVSMFPQDPSIYLVSLDKYVIEGNYDIALACVDSIDKKIGGDPFLNLHRGNIYYMADNVTKSAEKFSELVQYDLKIAEIYDSYLFILLQLGDHDNALLMVEKLVDEYEYTIEEVSDYVSYENPGFYDSTQFQNWLTTHEE